MSGGGGMRGSSGFFGELDRIVQEETKGAARGVQLAAEQVLTTARRYVPIEEGTLERSGKATWRVHEDQVQGVISFDTPYAVRMHEDMTLRHDAGRTAKYLERAMAEESDVVKAIIAEAVRSHLAGNG